MKLLTLNNQTRECLQSFFDNQLSPETRRAYKTDLSHFSEWIGPKPVNQISQSDLIGYREALLHCYSKATVIRRLAAVRGFFQHLLINGLLSVDPSRMLKLPRKPDNCTTEALTDKEVHTLLLSRIKNTGKGRFELALFSILFYLGLRRSEVCELKISDIGVERGTNTITVHGKGGKTRILPIPTNVWDAIQTHRKDNGSEYLLVPPGCERLNGQYIYRTFTRVCKEMGIANKYPHSARATFVSNALEANCNPVYVQAACGWADMNQIVRYDKRRTDITKSAVWKVKYE